MPVPYVPQAVSQEGVFLPAGSNPEAPVHPYGMGDARCFLDVPPLVHFPDGTTCINPDYQAVYKFSRSGRGRDPGLPEQSLVRDPFIAPGATVDFQITVEREEDGMGHFLINELFMLTDPDTPAAMQGLLVNIKTLQGDMTLTNAPAPAVNVFGTAFLSCCLPCNVMLYPNQTLVVSVTNNGTVGVRVQVESRGKRFMPYHNMPLVQEMERCWSQIQTSPYWVSFDETLRIDAAVGATPGLARGQMSLPGGGYFELKKAMVLVVPDGVGAVTAYDMEIEVTDGRIGKRFMDGPVNLGAHWAAETRPIAGFPGGLFRAVQACHCPPPTQMIKGNTRLIHDLTNHATTAAFVHITYAGCYHFADACPPAGDLDLIRRYGGADASALRRAQEAGDRVFFDFLEDNPLYVDQAEDGCAPTSAESLADEAFHGLGGLGARGESRGEWEAI
jgi:hypothetical protein